MCNKRRHLCLGIASLYLLLKRHKACLLLADALFAVFDIADELPLPFLRDGALAGDPLVGRSACTHAGSRHACTDAGGDEADLKHEEQRMMRTCDFFSSCSSSALKLPLA